MSTRPRSRLAVAVVLAGLPGASVASAPASSVAAPGPDAAAAVAALALVVLAGVLAAMRRRRARVTRAGSEAARDRLLFEQGPVATAVVDLATLRLLDANPVAERQYGWPREELLAMTLRDLCSPGHEEALAALIREVAAGREARVVQPHRRRDGAVLEIELAGRRIAFGGRPAALVVAHDVTSRVRAERALRESEARYRSLVEASAALVWKSTPRGEVVDAPGWAAFTGQGPAEGSPGQWLHSVHPDDREQLAAWWGDALRDPRPVLFEYRLHHRDGGYRWVSARGVPVRDETGAVREWVGTVTDIDDRRRAEAARQESDERLRRVADSHMIGVAFWDENGHLFDANTAFLGLVGSTREALATGTLDWHHLIPDAYMDRFTGAFRTLRETGTCQPFEAEIERRDGTRVPVLCAGATIATEPLRGVAWVVDITAQKRAQAEREHLLDLAEQARRDAEAASRAKDDFLALVSHELRNPLAATRTAVAAAQRDPVHARVGLDIARRQIDQLARLIDDLLDVARIARGRLGLRRRPIDLREVVEQALETVRPSVDEHGHRLVMVQPARPLVVDGDAARLQQVVVNLVANAVKYTTRGGRIALLVARGRDTAVLRVRDNGIGIAPEALPHLFEPFAQAEAALDRAEGGLGLGLTLVQRLVALHGGTVAARSAGPGRGAEFEVRLPLAQGVEAAAQPIGRARGRVLVVEDDRDGALSIRILLEAHGHVVQVASDGPAALAAAARTPFDLALVDIGLPGMDGYELARRLRTAHPGLRLVAVTGFGRAEDRARALRAGFDAHLVKPVDPAFLAELVGGAHHAVATYPE